MARIRTIKPEFWQDEDLSCVSESAMLVAVGLLNHADDEGFFNCNPMLVKSVIFPLREPSVSIHEILIELSNIEYISIRKGINGKLYGQVNGFIKHQKINRPTPSKIKDLIDFGDSSVSAQVLLTAGKERKGKERKGTGKGNDIVASDDAQVIKIPFEDFYSKYPVKKSKEPARKIWQRLNNETRELAITGIENYLKSTDPKFIAHPSTYLNNKRWEDESSGMPIPNDTLSHNKKAAEDAIAAIRARGQQNAIN